VHNALQGKNCQAFGSDPRVRVMPRRMYAYPDVTVVCGKPLLADDRQDILLNPTAIFEVLSPSIEAYDRGAKFRNYLTIDTLKDYVLLDQFTMRVEQYTRGADGTWTFRAYEKPEEQLKLDSIVAALLLARIYDGVELAPAED
jgi:Uma2 family endonuclease